MMDSGSPVFQSGLATTGELPLAGKRLLLLRLIRALQPLSRTDIIERLKIDRSTVTENVRPLIRSGVLVEEKALTDQGRRGRLLSFAADRDYFIGLNLGVRRSQVGVTTLTGEFEEEIEFETPGDPKKALSMARERILELRKANSDKQLKVIGVSVPGMTDVGRRNLLYAPNLGWRNVPIADVLEAGDQVSVVVENDSTAAATYEARMKIRNTADGLMTNFILVRSGTGIGVGLVIGGQVYRGTGIGRGIAGEFGHMTIVAGGKPCVCGNRGCWEKYASAAAASSLYIGDRPLRPGETLPRFTEIVSKAENGEIRSRRTLEKIGDYLGIGIANVMMGTGIPRVVISGRLVYAWQFISDPLNAAIERSIIGKTFGWSVEGGSPAGAAIGGALEVAVEEYLRMI